MQPILTRVLVPRTTSDSGALDDRDPGLGQRQKREAAVAGGERSRVLRQCNTLSVLPGESFRDTGAPGVAGVAERLWGAPCDGVRLPDGLREQTLHPCVR